ncbi:TVP38/TMEM64 family protein [Caldovatus aquaticus]|uniref:TVP38/TMEM64 family membrane protein n=1 Tax=Caldovatus aquaticus TaxID=2865671 RepID=A0ABS7F4X7_9PROT|nr:VTT domain-containing protein [Caldovatus aquaticus]MBW8270678.1 VTT domain-containing protein [Caldovatus aquaticus]
MRPRPAAGPCPGPREAAGRHGGDPARRQRRAAILRLLALAGGLAAAGLVLRGLGAAPGTAWVDRHVRGQGALGEAAFVAMGALATAAGVPRQGIAFLGGYAFGAAAGTGLALVAQLLGCALSFYWARLVGRGWAERRLAGRFGHRLRPLRDVLAYSPFGATLALRLLPVGNNLALNLLAGMTGVAALPYLAASALGYLPQTLVFALLGKGVRVEGAWQLALSAALFAASVAIGLRLLRRHRAARALGEGAPD